MKNSLRPYPFKIITIIILNLAEAAMEKKNITTFEEYFADYPAVKVEALQKLRQFIRRIVPEATETISYGMPMFKWNGMLVGIAAFKNHCSFFPCTGSFPKDLQAEVAPYMSGKSTIQFQPEKPLPDELIEKIVRYRMSVNEQKMQAKKAAKNH